MAQEGQECGDQKMSPLAPGHSSNTNGDRNGLALSAPVIWEMDLLLAFLLRRWARQVTQPQGLDVLAVVPPPTKGTPLHWGGEGEDTC